LHLAIAHRLHITQITSDQSVEPLCYSFSCLPIADAGKPTVKYIGVNDVIVHTGNVAYRPHKDNGVLICIPD